MSGGYFDYYQYHIVNIADEMEKLIEDLYVGNTYLIENKATEEEFRTALKYLKLAGVYAHRIDWLVSGDDSEETFHRRLKEDLEELNS